MAMPEGAYVREMNPSFEPPKRPFLRMAYGDAIEWLKSDGYKKEDGTTYEFGEVRESCSCLKFLDHLIYRTYQRCLKDI